MYLGRSSTGWRSYGRIYVKYKRATGRRLLVREFVIQQQQFEFDGISQMRMFGMRSSNRPAHEPAWQS
jgi:hypothetical protein